MVKRKSDKAKDANIIVIKRNGKEVIFDDNKICNAVNAAAAEVNKNINETVMHTLIDSAKSYAEEHNCKVSVDEIQKIVENLLMQSNEFDTARAYIVYRAEHDKARKSVGDLMQVYNDLTFKSAAEMSDKRDNANINTDSPMGTMLKYGSTGSNYFADNYMLPKEFSKAHKNGDIHIHDKDFYFLTFNCCQIDLIKLLSGGYNTGHGHLREPQSIRSYGSLACIAIQANQNDQFGGQSINAFDYAMAVGVRKTFVKKFVEIADIVFHSIFDISIDNVIEKCLADIVKNKCFGISYDNESNEKEFVKYLIDTFGASQSSEDDVEMFTDIFNNIYNYAMAKTKKETYQAMEAVVHNFNSMHSRAGAQVPFSSLNFGTDMSPEGRLVTEQLLLAQESGLGNGETPIFPILVFKLKSGVNFNPEDPGYYLFKLACRVSAKRLFPNFVNLDAPYNLQYYKSGDYNSEVSTMGCRTRVMGNVNGPEQSGSRGNIAFVSINLPKIALESDKDLNKFFDKFDKTIELCKRQLLHRYNVLRKKHVYNFPFLMGQGVWLGSEKLKPGDTIEEVLKQGSLSIGFVGLAETLVALTNKHHGESEESQKLGLRIVKYLRDKTDKFTKQTGLNFSTFATPAENLAGRFARINKKKFGELKGITDRDYLSNSFHVPVYYKISAYKKIDIEAPYHDLCNAGHITYIEMDGDPTKNLAAFEKVVRYMHDKGIGYGAINHPVDRDPICGYTGVIKDECPHCHRKEVEMKTIKVKREA